MGSSGSKRSSSESIFDFTVRTTEGEEKSLAEYRGKKAFVVVNVASACGLADKTYRQMVELYGKHSKDGVEILAFPSNSFSQEPLDDSAVIAHFAERYGATFPHFAKIPVNGSGTHPLYQYLKAAAPGLLGSEAIKWNYTKFLVGPDGKVIKRFGPRESIDPDMLPHIEALIAAESPDAAAAAAATAAAAAPTAAAEGAEGSKSSE